MPGHDDVFDQLLAERDTMLLLDGAMGTELFARGLTAGDPPEMWNIDMADVITDIHAGYIAAGSDVVLTNSFGGTAFRLALHGLDDRVVELNAAAARVARAAADAAPKLVAVAGSMGPSGELLEPMGTMTMATAEAAFAEQARGLAEGGVDLLWIETMSSLDEVRAAVAGARSATDLPIVATMSFDTAGRTMMGVSGEEAGAQLGELGLVAIGANCGNNIAETEAAVASLVASVGTTPVVVKANAGIPEWRGTDLAYNGTPDVMGAHVGRMRDLGVRVVGGCCGTASEHIAFMRQVIDGEIEAPEIDAPGPAARPESRASGERRPRRRSRA